MTARRALLSKMWREDSRQRFGSVRRWCLLELGLVADDEPDEFTSADLGDYDLLGEIGRGGQGVLYRARQKSLNRVVALKVIGRGRLASEAHLKGFRHEAESPASLEHPRMIPIYESGERDGACLFTMQLIEGGQLDELVRHGNISPHRAAEIIASLARTVHFAHQRGVLHRDIKPGNVLLDKEGEPHLAYFGQVQLIESDSTVTRTVEVLGTPSYIALDQDSGDGTQVTSATDVFSERSYTS